MTHRRRREPPPTGLIGRCAARVGCHHGRDVTRRPAADGWPLTAHVDALTSARRSPRLRRRPQPR